MTAGDRRTAMRYVPIAVTVVSVLLAVVHVARPKAAIDGTTLALLGVAALPWLGSVFKSIELPGGVRAEYRERLALVEEKVAEVERAVFRGGSPELRSRLASVLDHFAAYLAGIGLEVEGPVPEVDVSGAPEGFLSAYDASTDRILIDPAVAGDTASTLHEYRGGGLRRPAGRGRERAHRVSGVCVPRLAPPIPRR